MCLESQKGSPSYNDLASRHEYINNISASKQAFCKKVNASCVKFFQAVLAYLITSKINESEVNVLNKLGSYKRILIQDSTIVKLPEQLFKFFSGVSNASKSTCNARIQGIYDLVSGSFISFSIDSYSKNDISVASNLKITKGDLVLRDRGYFSNEEIKRHVIEEADCIYRFKKTRLFNPKSGEEINILNLLESKDSLDMEVCLNNSELTKVRLIAAPVCEETANLRRMKAKKETFKHNPSVELLRLMSWTIFITTISKEQADFNRILQIYGIRWRIEVIFKSWKSHMQFAKLHNVSKNQLFTLLTARFIMITLCIGYLYNYCYHRILNKFIKHLSLLKFIKRLINNPDMINKIVKLTQKNRFSKVKQIDDGLIKYCTYDKRKRLNFCQLTRSVFA